MEVVDAAFEVWGESMSKYKSTVQTFGKEMIQPSDGQWEAVAFVRRDATSMAVVWRKTEPMWEAGDLQQIAEICGEVPGMLTGAPRVVTMVEKMAELLHAARKEAVQARVDADSAKKMLESSNDVYARSIKKLKEHRDELSMRLRRTAQILIERFGIGVDGPMNADECARRAVKVADELQAELNERCITECERLREKIRRLEVEVKAYEKQSVLIQSMIQDRVEPGQPIWGSCSMNHGEPGPVCQQCLAEHPIDDAPTPPDGAPEREPYCGACSMNHGDPGPVCQQCLADHPIDDAIPPDGAPERVWCRPSGKIQGFWALQPESHLKDQTQYTRTDVAEREKEAAVSAALERAAKRVRELVLGTWGHSRPECVIKGVQENTAAAAFDSGYTVLRRAILGGE